MPQFAAATKAGGMAQAAPDVCFIPAPAPPAGPGGIPIPFPNIAQFVTASKTCDKVLIENKPTIVEDSEIPHTQGDEAGCSPLPAPGKGVVSHEIMGKCVFKTKSGVVFFKGKASVTQTATTSHNGSNANAPVGTHTVPSQLKVLVGL